MAIEISSFLANSIVITTLLFLVFVWIMVYRALITLQMPVNTRLKYSIGTALVLIGWFAVVYILGINGIFSKNPLFAPFIIFGPPWR